MEIRYPLGEEGWGICIRELDDSHVLRYIKACLNNFECSGGDYGNASVVCESYVLHQLQCEAGFVYLFL